MIIGQFYHCCITQETQLSQTDYVSAAQTQ